MMLSVRPVAVIARCTPILGALLCFSVFLSSAVAGATFVAQGTAEAEKPAVSEEHAGGAVGSPAAVQASESGGEAEADAGHDAHEAPGPPMEFTRDLALWSAIVFVLFLFVVRKAAWGPMIEGLDRREAGIRTAIADAEENRRKSEALLAEYQQKLKAAEQTVQEMVAEAKRDAERTSRDMVATTQKEVDAMRQRAKDEIRQATDNALTEVFSQINAQVAMATERVLGRALNDQDQDRLIEEALAEISR